MNWLTEEQWFDRYYPPEWGDWRKEYNYAAYADQEYPVSVPCTWMNYRAAGFTGFIDRGSTNSIPIFQRSEHNKVIESFLVEDTFENCAFMQPFYAAEKDGTVSYWTQVVVRTGVFCENSKYEIYIFGIDDTAYAFCSNSLDEIYERIKMIKEFGMEYLWLYRREFEPA